MIPPLPYPPPSVVYQDKIVEREVFRVEYRDPPPVANPYRTFTWSFWRIRITFGWRLDNQQNQA
jgi:hypothetical protein